MRTAGPIPPHYRRAILARQRARFKRLLKGVLANWKKYLNLLQFGTILPVV